MYMLDQIANGVLSIKNYFQSWQNSANIAWNSFKIIYDLALSSIAHHHRTNATENLEIKLNREQFWGKIAQACEDPNDRLCSHIKAFGIYDETLDRVIITPKSMYYVITQELEMDAGLADKIVAGSMGLPVLNDVDPNINFSIRGLEGFFSPEIARRLMHPSDSGLYEKGTGRFLNELYYVFKYCETTADNQSYISLAGLQKCITYVPSNEDRWKDAHAMEKIFGAIGNRGELAAVIDALSSKCINGEPHAKASDLKLWYTNTAQLIEKKRNLTLTTLARPIDCSKSSEEKQNAPDLLDSIISSAQVFAKYVVKDNPSYFPQASHPTTCSATLWYQPPLQNTCSATQHITAVPTPALGNR